MMNQLSGMIRYEMLMQWRRRGVLVMMIVLLVLLGGITGLVSANGAMRNQVQAALHPFDDEIRVNTVMALNMLLIALLVFAVTVPVMTAETVPVDHQYHVTDLLNSLPLTRTTYLLGKLLGLWSILLLGLGICFVIGALLMWALIGVYDPIGYFLMWLISVVPITLSTSALGGLVGSTQPTRRRAIMLIVPLSIFCYIVAFLMMPNVWYLMSVLRPQSVSNVFAFRGENDAIYALEMYLFLAGSILFCWLIAWTWQRWREGRA